MNFNGTKYGYVVNLQGDVLGLIDSTGAEVVKYTYDAWGKVLSTTGSLASTLGTIQPFRYRRYVYDVETGLYYLRSRYYNPEWGRFINTDAMITIYLSSPTNLFNYCLNNPPSRSDKDGTESEGCEAYAFGDKTYLFENKGGDSFSTILAIGTELKVIRSVKSRYYVYYQNMKLNEQHSMKGYVSKNNVVIWFGGSDMRQYCEDVTRGEFYKNKRFVLRKDNSYRKMNALMQLLLKKYFENKGVSKNIIIDGIYDQGTINLVKDFQEDVGLDPDGIIGQKTYNQLILEIESIP